MTISIAYLGPTGTYTESAALAYVNWLNQEKNCQAVLCAYPTIVQTARSVIEGKAQLAVVPVENSIQGSVAMTLDTLWELDRLQIQQQLVIPISHTFISQASSLAEITRVYSHPQALGQCQGWLEKFLPSAELIPSNSTTEALEHIQHEATSAVKTRFNYERLKQVSTTSGVETGLNYRRLKQVLTTSGAIASRRAAHLYNLPILATNINDYPDNCTRFWVLGLTPSTDGHLISLAFSVPANIPGTLVQPLQIFADMGINLSRIESRPTKRSLGEYLFFLDLDENNSQKLPPVNLMLLL